MRPSGEARGASQSHRRWSRWLLVGLALVPSTAAAHPEFQPARSNRYVKLSLVGGGALRVAYTVMIGELPALAARKVADRSGDGVVDAGEAKAYAEALRDGVSRGMAIDVDGKRASVAWEPPAVGGLEGKVEAVPFSIDLVGRVATGAGAHLVRWDDATPLDELGDTEIRLEEAPGTHIVAAWRGAEDGKRQTQFLFSGPKRSSIEDRSIGFRFTDGDSRRRGRAPLPIAMIGVLVGAIVSAVLMRRQRAARQRRMNG